MSNKKRIVGGLTIMKIKIINKILAGLLAASTIGAVAGGVSANPKKHLCNRQNIYDLKEPFELEQSADESDEEQDKQKNDVKCKNQVSQFVFLLNKTVWNDWDEEDFLEICLDFSDDDFLGECSLKQKLKVTDMLIKHSHLEECQERVAEILRNFSHYNFFKEYYLDQRIDITDALIECLGQDAAREDAVEAFSNLACDDFFKEYSTGQKVKIAKALTWCLSEGEFDLSVLRPLRGILEDSKIFEKLDYDEKSLCLGIIEKF